MSITQDLLASGLGSLRRLDLALVVVALAVLAVVAAGPSSISAPAGPGLVVVGSHSAVPQDGPR
jgi:hypothetical protein